MFDLKLLFFNVTLDFTMDAILKRIYKYSKIQTNIKKKETMELLLSCTKNVYFT